MRPCRVWGTAGPPHRGWESGVMRQGEAGGGGMLPPGDQTSMAAPTAQGGERLLEERRGVRWGGTRQEGGCWTSGGDRRGGRRGCHDEVAGQASWHGVGGGRGVEEAVAPSSCPHAAARLVGGTTAAACTLPVSRCGGADVGGSGDVGTARSVCALAAAAAVVWDVRLQETCGVGSGRGGGCASATPTGKPPVAGSWGRRVRRGIRTRRAGADGR